MKCFTSILLFFLVMYSGHSELTNTLPIKITIAGETYENVTWGTVTPTTVNIHHKTGVAIIPLELLPKDLQDRFGYDPEKVAKQLAAQNKLKADQENRLRNEQKNFDDERKSVLSKIDVLQKELLPLKGQKRPEIEKLLGTPLECRVESFGTDSEGVKKLQMCFYLLIPHYWLYISYDSDTNCFDASYRANDPRWAWGGEGTKEFSTFEHAKKRLEILEHLKAKKLEAEEHH